MTGEIIDPIRLHIESGGEAGSIIARACYVFQRGHWLSRWRKAQEEGDFHTLDYLDRQYEMIGLP